MGSKPITSVTPVSFNRVEGRNSHSLALPLQLSKLPSYCKKTLHLNCLSFCFQIKQQNVFNLLLYVGPYFSVKKSCEICRTSLSR